MNMPTNDAAPVDGAADPAAAMESGTKSVLITDNGDGSFSVADVGADMQPVGEATPAASIDEAMQLATASFGGGQGQEPAMQETPAEEAAQSPEAEAAEPTPEGEEMAPEAKYAQKRGTRPKQKPSWEDYGSVSAG